MLEGGYSDRALTSGALAHLTGLVHDEGAWRADEAWWSINNLTAVSSSTLYAVCILFITVWSRKLEAATKKRRGGRPSHTAAPTPWIARTLEVLASIDSSHTIPTASRAPIPQSDRALRERKPASSTNGSVRPSPVASPGKKAGTRKGRPSADAPAPASTSEESDLTDASTASEKGAESAPKKLPRVILKLGPAPAA